MRMQAAECTHNFVVDSSLQTTSTVVEESRCRSPSQSPSTNFMHQTSTPMRCRTVAVLRRWYRTLWASTTLAVGSSTDLFVASHWLERSSSRFSVTLLVFSRAYNSILQVYLLCDFYLHFLLKACFKSPPAHQTSRWLVQSEAVTSRAAVNSDARSIQISSQNNKFEYAAKRACKQLQCNKAKLSEPASINGLHNIRVYARASILSAYTNENRGGHIYTVTVTKLQQMAGCLLC